MGFNSVFKGLRHTVTLKHVTCYYTAHCHSQVDNFDVLSNCKLTNKDSCTYHDPHFSFTCQEHNLRGRPPLTFYSFQAPWL